MVKRKGHDAVPFSSAFDLRRIKRDQLNYECKTKPEDFAFQNRIAARPSSPVPSKNRDPGSGVTIASVAAS
jgi:hypothetical protein